MGKPRKDQPLNKPYYKGGNEAIKKFLADNLKYPTEAVNDRIEGHVEATYDVNDLGKTLNIRITESLGYGCDEEVIRLITMLKYEKAFNKGRNVTIHRKIKVDFKLPKQKKSTSQQIKYNVVSTPNKKKEPSKKAPTTITYTIKY